MPTLTSRYEFATKFSFIKNAQISDKINDKYKPSCQTRYILFDSVRDARIGRPISKMTMSSIFSFSFPRTNFANKELRQILTKYLHTKKKNSIKHTDVKIIQSSWLF